jgi:hypothetical protein
MGSFARAAGIACAAAVLAGAAGPVFDPIVFEERAEQAGLRFTTDPGRTPRRHQPETMVSGIALLDYDGDGWLDVYAVNGARLADLDKSDPRFWNRLFHNERDGSFRDVTEAAGVRGNGYDLGVASADYDNDGDPDLFVAGLRRNTLFRNDGNGRFSDVTQAAGLLRPDPKYGTLWSVAGAFFDYDRDGRLDLFVSNYCVWDVEKEPVCGNPQSPDYCHPKQYEGLPNSLFRNNGDGTFSDVSEASGIRAHVGKGMGAAVADFDDDGDMDVFVANDTVPAALFLNGGDGRFSEAGFERAIAYTERGDAVSGMGADARDVDNDGRPDVFETALSNETFPLFRNLGKAEFEDVTQKTGVAAATRARAGWANGIADLNNDGWKDLFVAAGDVMDPKGEFAARVPMANLVLANLKDGRFADASAGAGPDFARRAVHRGAAFGDLDNDGRVDVVASALDAPLELWRNVSPQRRYLSVKLEGRASNRDGIGAKLRLTSASGRQWNHVSGAVGYGGASDLRVHFGLGGDAVVQELVIDWPSGRSQVLRDVPADQVLKLREPD